MSKETGGPAFPYSGLYKGEDATHIIDSHGMTLRDYFAAKAMQSFLGNTDYFKEIVDTVGLNAPESVSHISYKIADAMIENRSK